MEPGSTKSSALIKSIREKIRPYRILLRNFSYLSALQVFNLLLPLITYPYLIRVLGKETYGLVVFAQAIIGYLLILVGFGFNISATKEVSIHRDDQDKLSEIVSSVLILKSGLLLVSLIILSVLVFFIPQATGYKDLFFLTMWMCLYDVIFPIWYFQGIEKMKYITWITLTSRLTFLALIFVLIKSPEDYLFIPVINGIGALLGGGLSLLIIFGGKAVRFRLQPYRVLKYYLKDSLPIFISNVSTHLYLSTNKVIVGTFLGMSEVAYYDLAEKITTVLKIPQSILSQTVFPRISKEKDLSFIKKIFWIAITVNTVLFILVILLSKPLVLILGGQQMVSAIPVLHILALTVPVIAMSNLFGVQLLISFGYNREFSRVIVTSGLVYLLQLLILWPTIGFTIISVSAIAVITEIFVTICMFHLCKKYDLWK
jgi:O-antigen/teichoic acid export membrane protein